MCADSRIMPTWMSTSRVFPPDRTPNRRLQTRHNHEAPVQAYPPANIALWLHHTPVDKSRPTVCRSWEHPDYAASSWLGCLPICGSSRRNHGVGIMPQHEGMDVTYSRNAVISSSGLSVSVS